MIIKIKERGWEGYNADLGTVQFKDGVSIRDISAREALSLGAFIHIVEVDADGNELGQISPALESLKASNVNAQPQAGLERVSTKSDVGPVVEQNGPILVDDPILNARISQHANERAGAAIANEVAVATFVAPAPEKHTQESLEAIASEKGIAGLREVALPFGVKNTSVKGLMAEILAAQDKAG